MTSLIENQRGELTKYFRPKQLNLKNQQEKDKTPSHIIINKSTDKYNEIQPPSTKKRRIEQNPSVRIGIENEITAGIRELELPCCLKEPLDYADLHNAILKANKYSMAVFYASIGLGYSIPTSRQAIVLSDNVLRIYSAFDRYWAKHRNEMKEESVLIGDDSSTDRLSSWVACFIVSTIALVASACISTRILLHDIQSENIPVFDASRSGVPFTQLTASSFESVRDQRIAQSSKCISDYTVWDILEALEAIVHSWNRLLITDDIVKYGTALQLRFGILMMCITRDDKKMECIRKSDDANLVNLIASKEGEKREYIMPSSRCIKEVAARLLPFSEMRVISHQNKIRRSPLLVEFIGQQSNVIDGEDFVTRINNTIDMKAAVLAVIETLTQYARETEQYGTISTVYRRKLQTALVNPGDPDVVEARHPRADASAKNIIKLLRGSRVFETMSAKSMIKPATVLASAINHIKEAFDKKKKDIELHNMRSIVTPEEEFAGLCAIGALVKGRFGLDWMSRFLVTRSTYRNARKLYGAGKSSALPVIITAWNTYDVYYHGTILRTTSLFESIAWWLAILNVDHHATIIVTNVSGICRTLSLSEISRQYTDAEIVTARRGMNMDALPPSTIVRVPLLELCDIIKKGPKSFVARVGDLEEYKFIKITQAPRDDDDSIFLDETSNSMDGAPVDVICF